MARIDRPLFHAAVFAAALAAAAGTSRAAGEKVLTGTAAYGDFTTSAPGDVRHIRPQDLPPPYATESARNASKLVPAPENAKLALPPGFEVRAFVRGFDGPRQMKLAPNGDIFLAESDAKKIRVLRLAPGASTPTAATFAADLEYRPYGLALYPPGPDPKYLYVGTEGKVLRFPYKVGDQQASGKPEVIVGDLPTGTPHWTRDVIFTPDGKRMLVAVGSGSNDAEEGMAKEARRADILDYDPEGHDMKIYASGIRNAGAGINFEPGTNVLFAAVNERDLLGDNLPPDYITRVKRGGFYGWPWFYIGGNQDPRHKGEHDELRSKVVVPDVLIQPHSAPLGFAFYTGTQFPASYRGSIFLALHGSWNRSLRTGYKIVRIPVKNGKPTGTYEDFMTGFVAPDGSVWGRPVGVVVAADGALLVSDDGSGTVWRIAYTGGNTSAAK